MVYRSTRECVQDLEKHGHLVRVHEEVDPDLEMAEIHRRVHQNGGPALLFERVKGSPFPAVSNVFGTLERARFIFRSTLEQVIRLMEAAAGPAAVLKQPWRYAAALMAGRHALPMRVRTGPVLASETTISRLPQIRSWPMDGGPFILLPQVYTEDPLRPGIMHSNLGMYRVQMGGNQYIQDQEIGLHYQIRRDIGIHHTHAIQKGEPLKVSIFVGGPPAHTLAAIMPLPEGMPEVVFAGLLAGRRFRYTRRNGYTISTDADFCITGTVVPGATKPEGPFGDHFGYYSLCHEFPFIRVEKVYCRRDAIWPFTVVGRPPQEDTIFGKLIHEITGPMVPTSIPGVKAVHAVDASGVHPLLLAIASERYIPYAERKPRELLTLANAILGFGHCSLAKYLFITAAEDRPDLNVYNIEEFITHVLERADWRCDLHFQTATTIDTLDYSGTGLNQGSKMVLATAGSKRRELARSLEGFPALPSGFSEPSLVMPGVVAVSAPPFTDRENGEKSAEALAEYLLAAGCPDSFALVVLTDDSKFASRTLNNFLWITFTRSNPSHDVYGAGSFTDHKHWGCKGPLIIDARLKPHHAPPLEENPEVSRRVDRLGKRGGSLHGII